MATSAPYDPSQDYAASYDALSKRIASNFAQQRSGLNQELASRGVQTSGVASIPSAQLRVGEANSQNDAASQYALEQARTGVARQDAAMNFERQKQLAQLGYDQQNALSRRMAQSGLESAAISGGVGGLTRALFV